MPFLAHPRADPDGTIWNLGVAGSKAMLWQLAPGGALAETRMLELPRASYIHDFTATARQLVIVLQPWIATRSVLPYNQALEWKPNVGTLVLVIDKADPNNRRTVELPPFSFFHLGDAWEEQDGTIRFDACVYDDPRFAVSEASELLTGRGRLSAPELSMVVLPPSGAGRVERTATFAEFPQGDKRRAGSRRPI
jgi:carotenoid cleavage dioxygenase-like enzyme